MSWTRCLSLKLFYPKVSMRSSLPSCKLSRRRTSELFWAILMRPGPGNNHCQNLSPHLSPLTRIVFCEAYKIGLFGSKIQWLIVGDYSTRWWSLPHHGLGCSQSQVRQISGCNLSENINFGDLYM